MKIIITTNVPIEQFHIEMKKSGWVSPKDVIKTEYWKFEIDTDNTPFMRKDLFISFLGDDKPYINIDNNHIIMKSAIVKVDFAGE